MYSKSKSKSAIALFTIVFGELNVTNCSMTAGSASIELKSIPVIGFISSLPYPIPSNYAFSFI